MSNLEALRYAAQKIHRKADEASKVAGSEVVWGMLEDIAESAAYLDQALLDMEATQPAGYHHMVEAVDFLEAAADAYERGYHDGRSRPKGYSDNLAKHRVAAELLAAVRGAEHGQ